MSINFSDNTKEAIVIEKGKRDSTLDVTLFGNGYTEYVEETYENLLHILENFASDIEPTNPSEGALWFDRTLNELKFAKYDISSPTVLVWTLINIPHVSTTAPVDTSLLWYDTSTTSLKFHNGTSFIEIGDSYLLLTGGTMTGHLTVNSAAPYSIDMPDSVIENYGVTHVGTFTSTGDIRFNTGAGASITHFTDSNIFIDLDYLNNASPPANEVRLKHSLALTFIGDVNNLISSDSVARFMYGASNLVLDVRDDYVDFIVPLDMNTIQMYGVGDATLSTDAISFGQYLSIYNAAFGDPATYLNKDGSKPLAGPTTLTDLTINQTTADSASLRLGAESTNAEFDSDFTWTIHNYESDSVAAGKSSIEITHDEGGREVTFLKFTDEVGHEYENEIQLDPNGTVVSRVDTPDLNNRGANLKYLNDGFDTGALADFANAQRRAAQSWGHIQYLTGTAPDDVPGIVQKPFGNGTMLYNSTLTAIGGTSQIKVNFIEPMTTIDYSINIQPPFNLYHVISKLYATDPISVTLLNEVSTGSIVSTIYETFIVEKTLNNFTFEIISKRINSDGTTFTINTIESEYGRITTGFTVFA